MLPLPRSSGKLERGCYFPLFSEKVTLEGEEGVLLCGEVNIASQIKLSNIEIETSSFSGVDELSSLHLEDCVIRCNETLLISSLQLTLLDCRVEIILPSEETIFFEFNSSQITIKNCSFSLTPPPLNSLSELTLYKSLNSQVSLQNSSTLLQNQEFFPLTFSQALESKLTLSELSFFFCTPLSLLFSRVIANSNLYIKKINIKSSGFIPFQLGEEVTGKKLCLNGEDVLCKKEKIRASRLDYYNHLSHSIDSDEIIVDTREAPLRLEPPSPAEGKKVIIRNPYCGTVIVGESRRRGRKIKLVCQKGKWKMH